MKARYWPCFSVQSFSGIIASFHNSACTCARCRTDRVRCARSWADWRALPVGPFAPALLPWRVPARLAVRRWIVCCIPCLSLACTCNRKTPPCWAGPRASGQLDTRRDPARATLQRQIVARPGQVGTADLSRSSAAPGPASLGTPTGSASRSSPRRSGPRRPRR